MAIRNITDEVEEMRAAKQLQDRIDMLSQEKAAFLLKSLLLAGHVTRHTMEQGLNLADTISGGA
jgi:hypothetical protein